MYISRGHKTESLKTVTVVIAVFVNCEHVYKTEKKESQNWKSLTLRTLYHSPGVLCKN